jgi:peroxiredoxin
VKKAFFVLSMVSVVGAFLVDLALLDQPAIRNGWWSILFFLVPLGFLVLGWSPDRKGKLGVLATVIFALGLAGYVCGRTVFGRISGTPAIAVGGKAPDFELPDQDGRQVALSDLTSTDRVVLVFFRTSACPNCRGQFREWTTRQADFKYSRVRVVAVGRVTPEEAKGMELPFTVLCDSDLAVARKYGLIHEKGYLFQDIARPTTLILGTDRVVRWMDASEHVRIRPSVEEILEELRK